MNRTRQLHDLGQSLWLDNITRAMLDDGGLQEIIGQFSLTGLTSNPTIFNEAIGGTDAYDAGILDKTRAGLSGEALFIELALEDLRRAADLFRPIFDATRGMDGWVSMEISPLLARDTAGSIAAAVRIHEQADRPNLFVKIPGTPEGIAAIEESIFRGIPVNVTLLFSREHYLAAADAYLRGIERRIAADLDPKVASVASLFISRWDKAISTSKTSDEKKKARVAAALASNRDALAAGVDPHIAALTSMSRSPETAIDDELPADLHNRLGIAIGQQAYCAYRALLASPRWQGLAEVGARPQRLLWASTGTKDPGIPDSLYVEALAAPDTINTMPEKTLRAFAARGRLSGPMATDGGQAEGVLTRFKLAGIDVAALASTLQVEGTASFVKSWKQLLARIADKSATLQGSEGSAA